MRSRKIAIVGPESTGKSTLAEGLAAALGVPWVPEYARHYIAQLQRPYTAEDILTIARGQLAWEDEQAAQHPLVICDTTCLVEKIWYEHFFGPAPAELVEACRLADYDLYLLCDIDIPWEPDPQREHPTLRTHFLNLFRQEVEASGRPWVLISGTAEERLQLALEEWQKRA